MTKAEFKDGISAVNEHWREAYETARRQVSGESYSLQENEEYGQLLMLWLLAAQGLDSMQGYKQGLGLLLDQLTFDSLLSYTSISKPRYKEFTGNFSATAPVWTPVVGYPFIDSIPSCGDGGGNFGATAASPERGNMAITLTPPGQDILQPEDEQARAPLNESPRWPGQDVAVSQEQAGASGPPQRGTVPLENGLLNLNRNGALEAGLESREPMQAESRTDNGDAGLSGDDDGEEEETFFDVDEEIGQEGMREAQSPRLENAGGRST
ncbi:hypothetical protein H2199_008989 [Coniosporium tulheliwenetii]|uniref:Uncharacterized protein n=1 Tax=Coniosporium tulheliwenetii TaxID=3383036 RepID=A0ACC2YH18_9PEZI|nr:hypothetical protein H2199_008989 [Cladosporium sp. JES 115]